MYLISDFGEGYAGANIVRPHTFYSYKKRPINFNKVKRQVYDRLIGTGNIFRFYFFGMKEERAKLCGRGRESVGKKWGHTIFFAGLRGRRANACFFFGFLVKWEKSKTGAVEYGKDRNEKSRRRDGRG